MNAARHLLRVGLALLLILASLSAAPLAATAPAALQFTASNPALPLLRGISAVAAGGWHSCALRASGGVKCWGWNAQGQVGDGTMTNRTLPVNVPGLGDVAAIAAGGSHTCALTMGGGVKCWGRNGYGQLGDGTTAGRARPVDVVGLGSGVTAITAGGFHTCAVLSGGGVKCWGWNGYGQLGDGTTQNRSAPVSVSGLSGASAVDAGWEHTCALAAGGAVKCWGSNDYGQLGDGTYLQRTAPASVSGLASGVTRITAGNWHSCAVAAGGAAKCWGGNWEGQIGDGTRTWRTTPVNVSGLGGGVLAIGGGWSHTCALTTIGAVKCWGRSAEGQVGNGATADSLTPANVSGLAGGVADISVGGWHNLALMAGGTVKGWGENGHGALGDNLPIQRPQPAQVPGLANVSAVTGGEYHTCVLVNGGVKCWGWNGTGELGDGTDIGHSAPANVSSLSSGVAAIDSGWQHGCALTTAGGLKCWGANFNGQLGDGSTELVRQTPVNVSGLTSGVRSITAGGQHTCALTTAGDAKCWGWNQYGQLGDGTNTNRNTPVGVKGLVGGITALSAGGEHTCALMADGAVKCWGLNAGGQLGDGSTQNRTGPVSVVGLSGGVAAVAAGASHTCALTNAGGVLCWGGNGSGQLGEGSRNDRTTPVPVAGLASGVAAIAAGDWHTCALMTGGGVKCWGYNWAGQIGDGSYSDRESPSQVLGLSAGASAIALASEHSCAIVAGGLRCWGADWEGQLGLGTAVWQTTPLNVLDWLRRWLPAVMRSL